MECIGLSYGLEFVWFFFLKWWWFVMMYEVMLDLNVFDFNGL